MISKSLVKTIRSLEQKKYRRREQLFVAEGPKVVGDLMAVSKPVRIIATAEWYGQQAVAGDVTVTEEELRKLSFLQHPQGVMALFPLPAADSLQALPDQELSLALDGIQDPGNLGTIIRIADWFGIRDIYCSIDTVDAYSPKVVQATMGSIARVRVHYTDLPELLEKVPVGTPVYGTFLDGKDLYAQPLTPHGIIVMGNEGNGISETVAKKVTKRLLIPSYPAGRPTAESLNVAIATAITCAEFRRQHGESR